MNDTTKKILNIFEKISQIPRCSKREKQLKEWLCSWASQNDFNIKEDQGGNLVINIPATRGYENKPVIIFQAHLDMVCEKAKESNHNFDHDPIRLIYEGDWLKADKTTLGADNGIGIALILQLAKDTGVSHPELELLFTVDEETGLNGASNLEKSIIKGKTLINLDSEEEGCFIIGCAGGKETYTNTPISWTEIDKDAIFCKINACGMCGGHSGIDINKNRANANSVIARILFNLQKSFSFDLIEISGGSAHNAIPRDAEAVISCNPLEYNSIFKMINEFEKQIQIEYKNNEPSINISLEQIRDYNTEKKLDNISKNKIINLIMSFPTGVFEMSNHLTGFVETSCNFAIMELSKDSFKIISSLRSSVPLKLDHITNKIESIACLSGSSIIHTNEYPSWKPNIDSQLLKKCKAVYKKIYNKEAVVESIHAGLECGIIGSKFPDMDMISFGPSIENAHSPEERVSISSIGKVWDFMKELIQSF